MGKVLNSLNDDQVIALRINGTLEPADYEIVEDAYVNFITVRFNISLIMWLGLFK